MARKVFISFLGFTNYGSCKYFKDSFVSDYIRFIQEATLDLLQTKERWTSEDAAYILLTDGAKKKNWMDDGHKDRDTGEVIRCQGLNTRLTQKSYPFSIHTIEDLPNGNNEAELFEIFRRVFEVIQDGDELYFDVTHGFRSLPMLILVLINYAKFLKGITVKSITYGNYDGRKTVKDDDTGVEYCKAPIIDLLPLSDIQNWTFATADYLKNGNTHRFTELATEYRRAIFKGSEKSKAPKAILIDSFIKKLKNVTDDFLTCRGNEIICQKHIKELLNFLSRLNETDFEPLKPVIKKIEKAFSPFKEDNDIKQIYRNGLEAAKWCLENKLYQQAVTILKECIVTYVCQMNDLDINNENERGLVNKAFSHVKNLNSKITEEKKQAIINAINKDDSRLINLMQCDFITDKNHYEAFGCITDERNDINHCGMRPLPHSAKIIRELIEEKFWVFYKLEKEEEDHEKSSYITRGWAGDTCVHRYKG